MDTNEKSAVDVGGKEVMKYLLITLIVLGSLYAPVELTRVIINWSTSGKFLFEIVFIWVFYVIAMIIAIRFQAILKTMEKRRRNE